VGLKGGLGNNQKNIRAKAEKDLYTTMGRKKSCNGRIAHPHICGVGTLQISNGSSPKRQFSYFAS